MRAFLLMVLVACSGSPKSTSETPGPATASMLDCPKVAEHVATTVDADRPRAGATHAAVKNLVETRCQADAWTDDTKQCLNAITTIKEGRACAAKMTDDQRAAIRTAARALRGDATPDAEPDDNSSDWIRHVVQDEPDGVPR